MHRKSGGDEIRRKGNEAFEYGRSSVLCRSTPDSSRPLECTEAAG